MKPLRNSSEDIHPVKVQLEDGSICDGRLVSASRSDERNELVCSLELEIGKTGKFVGEGGHFFGAMRDLRKALEPVGVKVLCFGARRDVWASGMQCDMGLGKVAYLLSAPGYGRKPQQSIYDYAPPESIGTVEEQERYAHPMSHLEPIDFEFRYIK